MNNIAPTCIPEQNILGEWGVEFSVLTDCGWEEGEWEQVELITEMRSAGRGEETEGTGNAGNENGLWK